MGVYYTREDIPKEFDYYYLHPALFFLVRVIAALSCLVSTFGSASVVYLIIRHKRYKKSMFERLMLGLVLNDSITSISSFILPFATPARLGLPLTIGNRFSCRLVPVFVMQGYGSFYYCGWLGLYFLLVIRYGWSEQRLRRWIEFWAHLIPWLFGWATSILLFLAKRYRVDPLVGVCAPDHCAYDENGDCLVPLNNDEGMPITQPYILGAFAMAIIGIACTWLVYWTVRMQEKSMQKYGRGNTLKQRKAVAMQAVYYSLACINGIVVSVLVELRFFIAPWGGDVLTLKDRPEVVLYLIPLFLLFPLQGFFNWIIYCRPVYVRLRGTYPNESRFSIYRRLLNNGGPPTQRSQCRKFDQNRASATTHRTSSMHGSSNFPLQNLETNRNETSDKEVCNDDVSKFLGDIAEDRTETTALDKSSHIIVV